MASSPPTADTSDADRRLREAEERLRDAIHELQLRQRRAAASQHHHNKLDSPPCDHGPDESCVAHAIGNLCQTFLLSYGVRVGIGILLRAFKLARRQSYSSLLDLKMLAKKVEKERDTGECCAYNSAKSKNKFHFWGSHWRHGDSLLFAVACAQVMYVFVMRPESLPKAYQDFIQKTGPVAEPVYKAVRDSCRGNSVDVASLHAYLSHIGKSDYVKLEEFPSIIPCSIIHPGTNSCLVHQGKATSATFKKTFPLYFSLTFVPFVVLHLQKFTAAPFRTFWFAIKGAIRSTSFLSAFVGLFQTFLLSYGVRVGIGILLRAFKLARRQSYSSLLDLKMLAKKVEKERDTGECCAYNSAKSKNKFHFWGSHWRHGDSLLFAVACAQVMYVFVMRPESLPKAYQDFIQKTGPVAEPVYKAVRDSCRGNSVDVASLHAYLSHIGKSDYVKLEEFPSIIPCSIIHPGTNSCLVHQGKATSATFKKTFPLYFSLTFVPFVVLHLQKFTAAPFRTFWFAIKGAIRSTSFLSAFVGLFQVVICLHRKVASRDNKFVYWIAGGVAALSVLLEKKARRGELALYVLPRAVDSLWYILVNRHLLPHIRNAEVFLFSMCMGGIMYYLEHEPETMAPFLRGLIRRFLASRISNPSPPSNTTATTYLQALDDITKPKLQEKRSTESSSEKLNLESIPGL
ncbi:hypothetical protein TanjilG_03898 [Lupinus angustifolius]|uniref:Transmembrane protein 135 N-terminal domain-containing protein n=1 Tax=Lupinus angustifolius TaxID=3871 RepID=A0A4P1R4M0_LUPAN|nr:hypothetical protein TanjilG_03898 [Lupinus angustifolius]